MGTMYSPTATGTSLPSSSLSTSSRILLDGEARADLSFPSRSGSPIFFAFVFVVRKAWNRVAFVKASEADLWSGIEEIEEHEASLVQDVEGAPATKWQKAKSWII